MAYQSRIIFEINIALARRARWQPLRAGIARATSRRHHRKTARSAWHHKWRDVKGRGIIKCSSIGVNNDIVSKNKKTSSLIIAHHQ